MAVTGRITTVQVSQDGKEWLTPPPPPDIGRFTYFYVWPYAEVDLEGTASFRCTMKLLPPEWEAVEITPISGVLGSGTYYFPFTLQTLDEAPLGVWSAEIGLEYQGSSGEWVRLDTWSDKLFNLIAVGEPTAQVVGVEFTKDGKNWFTTPLMVNPGEAFGYRVIFNIFLPLRTQVEVDLSLFDPYGNEVKKESPTAEFAPGQSQGVATFSIDSVPNVPGDWIWRAVIKAMHKGEWRILASQDGYACRVAAEAAPSPLASLTPVIGLAMVGAIMVPMSQSIAKAVRKRE